MATYNGWTNYETWAVNLWITNDEGSQRYWEGMAQECYDEWDDNPVLTRSERAIQDMAYRLKDEIEEGNPLPDSGLYTDLLNAALSEVNWDEIAAAFMDSVDKEEEEQEST